MSAHDLLPATLATLLGEIEQTDPGYTGPCSDCGEHPAGECPHCEGRYGVRNGAVYQAIGIATLLGYPAGMREDSTEPDCMVAYISLPTGQVSWHLPVYPGDWDRHTTKLKYDRCREYANKYLRNYVNPVT